MATGLRVRAGLSSLKVRCEEWLLNAIRSGSDHAIIGHREGCDGRAIQQSRSHHVSFWIIKILCTTLGETGGDAVTMSMNLGYAVGTAIFAVIFLAAVIARSTRKKFHSFLYWFTIVATTTVGTTMADLADRSGGLGYMWGSACSCSWCWLRWVSGTGRPARLRWAL